MDMARRRAWDGWLVHTGAAERPYAKAVWFEVPAT